MVMRLSLVQPGASRASARIGSSEAVSELVQELFNNCKRVMRAVTRRLIDHFFERLEGYGLDDLARRLRLEDLF